MTTPLVTRVNQALNPRVEASGAGAWSSAVGYGTSGAGSISYLTGTNPPVGAVTTARRKTWTTASTGGTGVGFMLRADGSNYTAVTAGMTYTVSVYVRHSVTDRTYALRCRFFNGLPTSSTQVGADVWGSNVVVPAGTGWTRLSITFVVPAGALSVQINPETVTGEVWPIGATQDATGLLIEAGPLLNDYFDGAYPDTAATQYDWTDVAHISTSRQTDLVDPLHTPTVRNQLSYWDGATWPQIGPRGITGPTGPTGPDGQAARTSCGGCRFRSTQTAQPSGAIWDADNFVVDTAVSTDPNPCLGIAASNELQVLRNTTAMMLTATLRMTTGAPITARSCISFFLNGSLMLGRTSVRENEDTVTVTAIGHLALGDRIRVQVYLNTTGTPYGYNCYVTAALAP